MRRVVLILLWSLCCGLKSFAWNGHATDSLVAKNDSTFTLITEESKAEYFEQPDNFSDGLVPATATDSVQRYIDLAQALLDKVEAAQNFISTIDANSRFELPVGIKKTIGGLTYNLIIEAIRLKPTHAELDVFLQFTIPQNGKSLTFMARSIKLTKKGGIVGDAKLELLGDNSINFNGDKIQLILKGGTPSGGSGTYAIIDCDGFREMSLNADVKFSRDLIRPENADGNIIEGNVVAGFKAVVSDWNDLLIQLNIPAFQVTSLQGFGFKASDVVFDFSDTRNAPSVVFPKDYNNTQTLPGNANLWRGFYMRELLIRVPQQFQKKSGAGTELRAQNMIIDNRGVSGLFSATNLIPLNEGTMAGWAFSLDSIGVNLVANELQEAGINGQILIPVSKENTPFNYLASISDNEYLFVVEPTSNIEFDVWQAHVDIYPGSSLEIKVVDKKFLPKAILHGRMDVNAKLGEGGENAKGVSLANITFEDLQLQTVKPYLKVGNFSFGSEAAQQKLAQFPISIQNIGMRSLSDTETALDFNLLLNLVGEDNGAFAADAGLSLIAKISTTESGHQKWKPKDIEVRSIKIDIDGGAFKFNGSLAFYKQDVVYGNGFNGQISAEFKPGIKVRAGAIFGNVEGMRYWYADAMVNFPAGIPIFTGVGIYGFGGGAYFAMKMDNQGLGSSLGQTSSGVIYIPDTKAGLGLKAVVAIGSHPKPEAFNGDVTFEISFFKGGGVRRIGLMGNGYLVTPGLEVNVDDLKSKANKMVKVVKKYNEKVSSATYGQLVGEGDQNDLDQIFGSISNAGQKGQISAHVSIDYDFENRVLHGNFEAFVNVAGGIVKGVGDGGRAGWAVLHFAPKDWYVYVGTPNDRIGLSVGIGSIRATATSYMMVGTKILDSPPPPKRVSKILGGMDLDYMKDLNAIGDGGGFAFGSAFEVSTGNLNFLMFYARFDAGAGFDIMLKDYGDTRCKGSNSRIGINGWYANGQAYAYFEGDIGIRVRVFGRKKKIEILSIGAAAVLQAKLPNPFWMRGVVGGHFRVLGGMVRGKCKFQVTLGNECEIVRDDDAILDDIKVIAELTPGEGELDVDVFTTPQALFNIPVEQPFELVDELNGNAKRSFRVKLDHVKLIANKTELQSTHQWNEKNDVLVAKSHEILPPETEVTLSVQVSFEEMKNGVWATVQVDGKKTLEVREQHFKTGKAPTYIPHHNVAFSYPAIGQVNLYKDESRKGYIQLIHGQSYLFETDGQWKREGRFVTESGEKSTFDFSYTSSTSTVNLDLPTNLKTDQVYTIYLMNVPVSAGGNIDRNVTEVSQQVTAGGEALETEVASKKAEGSIAEQEEQTVYSALLRSSNYSTFSQKMNSFQYSRGWTWQLQVGVRELGMNLSGNELFDKFEVGSDLQANNLVRFEADLSGNPWYELVYPMTYQQYPILGKATVDRPLEPLGFPPTKAIYMRQLFDDPVLTQDNLAMIKSLYTQQGAIVYNLSQEMYRDFTTIRAKCADLSLTTSNDLIHSILFSTFPSIREGEYKVKIRYYLPGSNKVNSEETKVISYFRN